MYCIRSRVQGSSSLLRVIYVERVLRNITCNICDTHSSYIFYDFSLSLGSRVNKKILQYFLMLLFYHFIMWAYHTMYMNRYFTRTSEIGNKLLQSDQLDFQITVFFLRRGGHKPCLPKQEIRWTPLNRIIVDRITRFMKLKSLERNPSYT